VANKFEKELEKFVKSRHSGHDEVVKKVNKWAKELEENIDRVRKTNEKFLKELDGKLGYMDTWFSKKEKQFQQMLKFFEQ